MVKRKLRKIERERLVLANKIFGGRVTRNNALDYGIEVANSKKNPFDRMAHITRVMTSDHAFSDGNKRTALVSVTSDMSDLGLKLDRKKLVRTMINLSKSGEGNINKIKRKLQRCSRR